MIYASGVRVTYTDRVDLVIIWAYSWSDYDSLEKTRRRLKKLYSGKPVFIGVTENNECIRFNEFKEIDVMKLTREEDERINERWSERELLWKEIYAYWKSLIKTNSNATTLTSKKFNCSESNVLKAISHQIKFDRNN